MSVERFLNDRVDLHCGDCRDVLATLPENSLDACVTDPPYHLTSGNASVDWSKFPETSGHGGPKGPTNNNGRGHKTGFMGKVWDGGDIAFRPETWAAVYRVLKPGAHLVAMGGTRTYHRLACAIEDAGFEIRDTVSWLYGSGFPKSHDVSKGIDRAAGAEREIIGPGTRHNSKRCAVAHGDTERLAGGIPSITAPATDAAREWQGWGTALKPSHEDIVLAQKPFDLRCLSDILALKLLEGICQLPSFASAAENDSPSNRSVFVEGFGSAQWNAVRACNTPVALFDLMDTWPCESAIPSSLNTALSWLAILVEVSTRASTFTIETETGLITDLKILQCLWSQTTADCIIEAATRQHGIEPNASIAEYIFSAVAIRLKITSALSAHAPALEKAAGNSLDAGLSPEAELIVLARKPLSECTVAANVLRWGTGAINVDGCRIGTESTKRPTGTAMFGKNVGWNNHNLQNVMGGSDVGRWPANVVHDGSDEVVAAFPESDAAFPGNPVRATANKGRPCTAANRNVYGDHLKTEQSLVYSDSGSAARFFYTAKADKARFSGTRAPRDNPIYGKPNTTRNAPDSYGDEGTAARFFYTSKADADDRLGSKHPTVKPLDLMQWLVRLVCPPKGTCLDPFAGTGTTGEAAWREGMSAVLIEREAEYQEDCRRRMKLALAGPDERQRESIKARNLPRDEGPLFAHVARETWAQMWQRSFDFSQEPKS